eukprot:m.190264 g.190264  ORF g.190264 m.190264 type:complete len:505 (-) comp14812_c1_seq4:5245-6759(-)
MGQKASLPPVEKRSFRVCVITWNLGNKLPDPLDWIAVGDWDIVAIGTQEGCYEGPDGLSAELHWQSLLDGVFPEDVFTCVDYQTLSPRTDKTYKSPTVFKRAVEAGEAKASGIRLAVYVHNRIARNKAFNVEVETLMQTCGRLDGQSGNKGAVCINLNINGASISFIGCHFNAHMEKLERRNQDFDVVTRSLHDTRDVFGEATQKEAMEHAEVTNRHSAIFFFGDFNYRLQPLPDLESDEERQKMREMVLEGIRAGDWRDLMKWDQLRKQISSGAAFFGYEESTVDFPPTFKFNLKAPPDATDPSIVYNAKRVPSYCDRILYRSRSSVSIECVDYRSLEHVTSSDHKPVVGTFNVSMPCLVDFPKYRLKQRPREFHLTMSDLILVTEESVSPAHHSSFKVVVQVYHPCLVEPVVTEPCSSSRHVWDGPYVLEFRPDATYAEIQAKPLVIKVRNCEASADEEVYFLGEGFMSLIMVEEPLFKTSVEQGGKFFGTFACRVDHSAIL